MTHSAPWRTRSADTLPARRETRHALSLRAFGAALLLSAGALLAITSPSFAADPVEDLLDGLASTLQAGSQASAPLVDDVSESLEPVIDDMATMSAPASEELASTVTPVVAALSPALDLTQPVAGTLVPVTDTLHPVTASLSPTLQALEPMTGALQPLSQPVLESLAPVTAILAPAIDPLSPILAPLGEAEAAVSTGGDLAARPVQADGSATVSAAASGSNAPLDARTSDMVDTSGSDKAGPRAERVEAPVHAANHDVAAPPPDLGWGIAAAAATPLAPARDQSGPFGSSEATMTAAGSATMLIAALMVGLWLSLSQVWRTWSGVSLAMSPSRALAVPVPPG